jgi:nucleoside-diphosphate kinase
MIKPDAVANGHIGSITNDIQRLLTSETAGESYALQQSTSFYNCLMGSTNPAEAADGTIRQKYAKSIDTNAVHGSESDENAQMKGNFFPTS